ncbi:hypothetical protein, partial [Nocardia cyriacigeorgica]|uniref:hypothetical protein n=1 Tax=Nocardia cyriacigeorgica TaxID=135487 RepID=UPI0024563AA6
MALSRTPARRRRFQTGQPTEYARVASTSVDLVTADAGRYAGLVLTGVPENFSMQGFRGTAPHMGKG